MDIQKEIDKRLRTAMGDLQVQLIVAMTNLEAAHEHIAELMKAKPEKGKKATV